MSRPLPPIRPVGHVKSTGESLSPDEIRRLCDLLYRRTGMIFGESKRYYIERRVSDRMSATGMPTFPVYFSHVQASEDEVENLINIFTVNETYFYREEHQLQCLGRSLLPNIVQDKKPGDLVRIWSVPCSSGEEPYSIAIWLLENWPLVDAYHIEIVGSDIDTRVLQMAVTGRYGERALSRLPPDVVERYFERPHDGERRIIQDLRESMTFTSVNLVDKASIASQGRFDIVFCRNVLIYFDDTSRLLAATNLYDALNPGGYICLGHTESMSRISNRFRLCRFEDAIVYQRLDGGP
ncbi:CheR family methyltransferase [Microvirga mediterraneensis]|uniref:Chemotaxis protein methyltransferase n=1 Tax=Microvirga mediterraneensis TaxID=2754695 RepID=A0A838BPX8_9HYPH|nr:protein-glutamate O-methyltransferase CheR [Microvirga mediterraneensis]MBA1157440.1 protein-glutamate O-methyltransferase CheR [Microvirga mediterraneensis]